MSGAATISAEAKRAMDHHLWVEMMNWLSSGSPHNDVFERMEACVGADPELQRLMIQTAAMHDAVWKKLQPVADAEN